MKIKRRNHGKGHSYIDTETNLKVRSVTGMCKGVPKHGLEHWAAETTANFAIDHWDELAEMLPSERRAALIRSRIDQRNAASSRGTKIHALASRLIADEEVEIPDGLYGYVMGYVDFLNDFDVQPILVEAVVVSHEHRYAGTLDVVAQLLTPTGRENWLYDIKTGKGVYGEAALQLAGYRYADVWMADDDSEQPMPLVDRTGVVHLHDRGYELLPVIAEERQYRQFLYAAEMVIFDEEARELIGEPIAAPRRAEDDL